MHEAITITVWVWGSGGNTK